MYKWCGEDFGGWAIVLLWASVASHTASVSRYWTENTEKNTGGFNKINSYFSHLNQ